MLRLVGGGNYQGVFDRFLELASASCLSFPVPHVARFFYVPGRQRGSSCFVSCPARASLVYGIPAAAAALLSKLLRRFSMFPNRGRYVS